MKGGKKTGLMAKAGTQSVLASLISIIIGLAAGALVIIAVGLSDPTLGGQSIWDGIRLVFMGLFSTGRDAAGALTFGFNPASVGNMLFRATPLILTGLSVAVAFKTGLFNIGAPGQYLAGTAATLFIALGIPTHSVPGWLIWTLAFLGGMAAGALSGKSPDMSGAISSSALMWTISGLSAGRPFAANILSTALPSSAFAPSPYTVSVGKPTTSPARISSAAHSIARSFARRSLVSINNLSL